MKVHLLESEIVVRSEGDGERAALAAWAARHAGASIAISAEADGAVRLSAAGSGPINITFDTTAMPLRLISNLAETPFEVDGRRYASIEGFWQGLKFAGEADRLRLASLAGHAAKSAGPPSRPGDRLIYQGHEICVGTVDHWGLMERACIAKFDQHSGAREALLATGMRRLVHEVDPDSRTIPGIVMADIWMRIRARIAKL